MSLECTRCTAPTAEGIHLCATCAAQLTATLDQIPDALATARDTVARLDATGTSSGGGGNPAKPPVNLTAMEAVTELQELCVSWARMTLEHDDNDSLRNVESVPYLKMSLHIIRGNDWAGDLLDELDGSLRKVIRAVDVPPEVMNMGRCWTTREDQSQCPGLVRRVGSNSIARCHECGETYEAAALLEHLKDKGRAALAPLSVIVKALHQSKTIRITQKSAERWVAEGHLVSEQMNDKGVRLFTATQVIQAAASKSIGRPRKAA
ncbi:hypothetical protein [Citricoccus sp. K5]|uniref:hypothetical protein n=1 Tax=Citricoccus sp. K5 TaxID=2653135 RepID=UPI0012EF52CC|nr:hypothetical protein [Citricoccus sp. K5]VXB23509.1 conserved hypothetical protein [Citricoccus sp. K5]